MINQKIIQIASDTKNYGLKNKSMYGTSIKNKKCGDVIKVELDIKLNQIINMRYETSSCIYCQATASLLSRKIKLFKVKTLKNDIENILKILRGINKLPVKLKLFKEILNKKNIARYDCIMLPFNALKKALKI